MTGTGEPLCYVVLLGPASESTREQLTRGLQERFRLTPHQAETLIQRAPVVVKRGITMEKATGLVQHLEEIGARVRIERGFPEQKDSHFEKPGSALERTGHAKTGEVSVTAYCSWEDMENLGFFRAFFSTIRDVLFHPSRFFSRMPVEGGLIHPLIFALIMGVLGGVFSLVYQFLFVSFLGMLPNAEGTGGFQVPMMIGSAIGLPIMTIIGVFLVSAVLHVCLMIVRGNKKGFEATFRVVAYTMSTQIFGIIPLLGGLIGGIWTVVVQIIGIRESHGISTGRSALAIFLPVLVIVVLGLVLAAVMIPVFFRIFREIMGGIQPV
jgi:hypothetical protein